MGLADPRGRPQKSSPMMRPEPVGAAGRPSSSRIQPQPRCTGSSSSLITVSSWSTARRQPGHQVRCERTRYGRPLMAADGPRSGQHGCRTEPAVPSRPPAHAGTPQLPRSSIQGARRDAPWICPGICAEGPLQEVLSCRLCPSPQAPRSGLPWRLHPSQAGASPPLPLRSCSPDDAGALRDAGATVAGLRARAQRAKRQQKQSPCRTSTRWFADCRRNERGSRSRIR